MSVSIAFQMLGPLYLKLKNSIVSSYFWDIVRLFCSWLSVVFMHLINFIEK